MPVDQTTFRGRLANADPGEGSLAVTKSDTTTYDPPLRSLYVEGAGDVAFVGLDGVTDIWAVPDNFIIPVAMVQVLSAGTDATGLHGIR